MNAQTQDQKLEQTLGFARSAASEGRVPGAQSYLKDAREYAAKVGLDIAERVQQIESTLKK